MRSTLPLLAALALFACSPIQNAESASYGVAPPPSSARVLIGDIDGFGISPTTGLVRATPAPHNQPADVDGDGMIEPSEFLPDWNKNGATAVGAGDDFDRRSPAERAATNGAQWTDHSITPAGASNGATFTFDFTPPPPGDRYNGVDHFINFVFGDYDVVPASIRIDGTTVALHTQPGNQDGLVQAAYAVVPWSTMTDGRVVITVIAPNEPYLAFDYALLDSEPIAGCNTDAACDDGDACTTDTCSDGDCTHQVVSCDDGDACTTDACDPATGCHHGTVSCDDGDACTTDACNSETGCHHETVSCDDGDACTLDTCNSETGCHSENQCPDCSAAAASAAALWPPNHKLVGVGVGGVTDPQGQETSIRIDAIAQDEPTNALGDGNTCPDASGIGTATALLRAERSGTGDGRVYHVSFTATDPDGYTCSGQVTSCVPHDQGAGASCVDQGALYDSLACAP